MTTMYHKRNILLVDQAAFLNTGNFRVDEGVYPNPYWGIYRFNFAYRTVVR